MGSEHAVPSLMFMTLGIVVVIAAIVLVWFLRKRSNRHPLEGQAEHNVAREIDERKRGP